jgi:hypothetical protein
LSADEADTTANGVDTSSDSEEENSCLDDGPPDSFEALSDFVNQGISRPEVNLFRQKNTSLWSFTDNILTSSNCLPFLNSLINMVLKGTGLNRNGVNVINYHQIFSTASNNFKN